MNIDFDQTTTDDLIDNTNLFDITYNQDFQIKLDENLRVKVQFFKDKKGEFHTPVPDSFLDASFEAFLLM